MGRMPSELELRDLYIRHKKSLSEIASITGFKIHKIIYWMDRYGIKRRVRSEANYIKANPDGEPFKIKKKLTRDEVKLKYLALGLYWGEGGKNEKLGVRIANSDPGVIREFYFYLVNICRVRKDKIHFYLQTFKDNDMVAAKEYWAEALTIPADRINTGTPVHSLGKGTYKRISKYGVITLGFFNTHLQSYIMKEIAKISIK